jgi:hypothetical protein
VGTVQAVTAAAEEIAHRLRAPRCPSRTVQSSTIVSCWSERCFVSLPSWRLRPGCSPALRPSDPPVSLAGTVLDAVTSRPIAGAIVAVQGQTATSGADGFYFTNSLERGTTLVRVSHPNYVSAERQVRVTEFYQGEDFRLQPR